MCFVLVVLFISHIILNEKSVPTKSESSHQSWSFSPDLQSVDDSTDTMYRISRIKLFFAINIIIHLSFHIYMLFSCSPRPTGFWQTATVKDISKPQRTVQYSVGKPCVLTYTSMPFVAQTQIAD